MTEGGTYTLVFSLPSAVAIQVGALGEHRFPAGGYCYTGSALGSGGFSRIDRHRRVAADQHDVRHWHVDYVGGHSDTEVVAVERTPEQDCECAVAQELGAGPISGFGASDCSCETHLSRFETVDAAVERAAEVHDAHR